MPAPLPWSRSRLKAASATSQCSCRPLADPDRRRPLPCEAKFLLPELDTEYVALTAAGLSQVAVRASVAPSTPTAATLALTAAFGIPDVVSAKYSEFSSGSRNFASQGSGVPATGAELRVLRAHDV